MTNCSNCSAGIEYSEVQKCTSCDMDGLGNCCIGVADHDCDGVKDE